jgi:SET domain-containing protein
MIKEKNMYKPLPESLTIKTSGVHGLGLFADQKIMKSTNLGMSHLELGKLILRTPLGGFVNHSIKPNCTKTKLLLTHQEWNHLSDLPDSKYALDFKKWNLVTIKDIKEGEELTVQYTFYEV